MKLAILNFPPPRVVLNFACCWQKLSPFKYMSTIFVSGQQLSPMGKFSFWSLSQPIPKNVALWNMVWQPWNGKISHPWTFTSKLSHLGRRINISKNMTFRIPEQMLFFFFFFLSRIPEPDLVNCLIRIFRTHKYRICVKNNSYKARNLRSKRINYFFKKTGN